MAQDTIREFLVGIGFKIDESSYGNFTRAVEGATFRAHLLADAVESMAKAALKAVEETASSLEDLNREGERYHSTVEGIRSLEYALSQLGTTAEAAHGSFVSFGDWFNAHNNDRGAENWLHNLGVETRNAKGEMLDLTQVFLNYGKMTANMDPAVRQKRDELVNISAPDVQSALAKNAEAQSYYDAERAREASAKINQAGADSTAFEQQKRTAIQALTTQFMGFEGTLSSSLTGPLTDLNKYLDEHKDEINNKLGGIAGSFGTMAKQWEQSLKSFDWKTAETGVLALGNVIGQMALAIGRLAIAMEPLLKFLNDHPIVMQIITGGVTGGLLFGPVGAAVGTAEATKNAVLENPDKFPGAKDPATVDWVPHVHSVPPAEALEKGEEGAAKIWDGIKKGFNWLFAPSEAHADEDDSQVNKYLAAVGRIDALGNADPDKQPARPVTPTPISAPTPLTQPDRPYTPTPPAQPDRPHTPTPLAQPDRDDSEKYLAMVDRIDALGNSRPDVQPARPVTPTPDYPAQPAPILAPVPPITPTPPAPFEQPARPVTLTPEYPAQSAPSAGLARPERDLGNSYSGKAGSRSPDAPEKGSWFEGMKNIVGGAWDGVKSMLHVNSSPVSDSNPVPVRLVDITAPAFKLNGPDIPGGPIGPDGTVNPLVEQFNTGPGGGGSPGGGPGGGNPGAGKYNVKAAYDLIKLAGGTDEEARTLSAISQAESTGNPNAHNKKGLDDSYGLWQINMLGNLGPDRIKHFGLKSNEDLFDPETNARVALQMEREANHGKGGYNDWSTYNSGAYRRYYGGERDDKSALFSGKGWNASIGDISPGLLAEVQKANPHLSPGQCVALVQDMMHVGNVHDWRRGESEKDAPEGAALATFGQHGDSDLYAYGGSGTPGINRDHALKMVKKYADGSFDAISQDSAHSPHLIHMPWSDKGGEGDASSYFEINNRFKQPAGDNAGLLSKPYAAPWDKASAAWAGINAALPIVSPSTTTNNKTISPSVTITNHVTTSDPQAAATMVGSHIDRAVNNLTRNLQSAFQ